MIRPMYIGVIAGLFLSLGAYASEYLLPSPMFGVTPILALIVPFGLYLLVLQPGRNSQLTQTSLWGLIISTAILPLLSYGIYIITDYAAFIGQTSSIGNGLWLVLFYAILVGIPLLNLTVLARSTGVLSTKKNAALIIIGSALGLFIHRLLGSNLQIEWLAIIAVIVTTVYPFVVKGFSGKQGKSATETASPPKRKGKARGFLAGGTKHFGFSLYAFVVVIVWGLIISRKAAMFLMAPETLFSFILPATILVFGLGIFFGMRIDRKQRLLYHIIGYAVIAIAIIVGMYRWNDSLFPELYTAYYNSADITVFLAEWLAWLIIVPFAASGLLLGMANESFGERHPTFKTHPIDITIVVIFIAILGDIQFVNIHIVFIASVMSLALSLAWLIGRHSSYKLPVRIPVTLAVTAILVILALKLPEPKFENLFDPSSFQIVGDVETRTGSCTLLHSRNYDDPFYTVFWNQSVALTQNSNDARPDLERFVHLPLLLHPKPERVLMLGMGSFEKYAAFELHGSKSVTVVESNPAMVTLYNAWLIDKKIEKPEYMQFHAERLPAFAARNSNVYDVIISSEPFAEPYRLASIFTASYYEDIARATGDSGIFVQWLPYDGLRKETTAAIASAIGGAYPNVKVWTGALNIESPMIAFVASHSPVQLHGRFYTKLSELMQDEAVAFDLLRLGMPGWEYLAAEYAGGNELVGRIAGETKPFCAFSNKKLFNKNLTAMNFGEDFRVLLEQRQYLPSLIDAANDSSKSLVRSLFDNRPGILRAELQLQAGNDSVAILPLIDIIKNNPQNLEAKYTLANAFTRQGAELVGAGRYSAAVPALLQASGLAPLNTYLLRLFLIASMQTGDTETARTCLAGIMRLNPKHAGAKDNQATIKAQKQQIQDALLFYENAITLDAQNEEFYCNMASLQYNAGRAWEAVRILDNAVDNAYYPAKAYFLMGMIYGEGGKIDLALESYDNYLSVAKPNDPNRALVLENISKLKSGSSF